MISKFSLLFSRRYAKLEKADLLELTVNYLKQYNAAVNAAMTEPEVLANYYSGYAEGIQVKRESRSVVTPSVRRHITTTTAPIFPHTFIFHSRSRTEFFPFLGDRQIHDWSDSSRQRQCRVPNSSQDAPQILRTSKSKRKEKHYHGRRVSEKEKVAIAGKSR